MTTVLIECRRCLSRRAPFGSSSASPCSGVSRPASSASRRAAASTCPRPGRRRRASPTCGAPMTQRSACRSYSWPSAPSSVGRSWSAANGSPAPRPTVLTRGAAAGCDSSRRGWPACAALAMAISVVLLVAFVVVGVLPAVAVHGELGTLDGVWAAGLVGGVARNLALVGLAAAVGGAIAGIGRSTTAAVVAVFVYEAVLEPLARALWPGAAAAAVGERGGVGDRSAARVRGGQRGVLAGGLTLAVYAAVVVALALVTFDRRDVAA